MANQTRFEGRVNANDLPALKVAAARMSDHQLVFFHQAFKFTHQNALKVVRAEMALRCTKAYQELFGD